jgi:hypothetical protein
MMHLGNDKQNAEEKSETEKAHARAARPFRNAIGHQECFTLIYFNLLIYGNKCNFSRAWISHSVPIYSQVMLYSSQLCRIQKGSCMLNRRGIGTGNGTGFRIIEM